MKNLNSEADVRSTRKYLLLLEINENNSEKEKSSVTISFFIWDENSDSE